MKQPGKIVASAAVAAFLLCLVGGIVSYVLYSNEAEENKELKEQLAVLSKQEKQSAVMQRVNAQMEEIANEERRISEEQREAAVEQTKLAEQERRNAEQQRHEAEQERQNALIAESKAVEASKVAQHARAVAEQQRAEAEHSKRVTDTLSYITLGRSLGTVSLNQLQAGNAELADLLSFAAFTFTDRYHGDVYNPAVYQSLVMTSQSKSSWNKHKGTARCVVFRPNGNHFLTTSTYGEVMEHFLSNNQLNSKMLFSDKQFDFRAVYTGENKDIYAVDRNGRVLIITHDGQQKMLSLSNPDKLLGITSIGNQLLVVGECTLSVIDPQQYIVSDTRKLNFRIVSFNRYDYSPVVFDNQGHMHVVRALNRLESSQVPFKGQVTAFASSKSKGLKAYGMRDGTIYLMQSNGKSVKLVGHRSQVTKIKINGNRIYSSGYDGNLMLWAADQEKIEPITLFTTQSWIMDFNFDNKKEYIWAVDQKGNITEAFISVPKMVDKLRNKLKRNLTQDEWDYYVGRNIPYERFLNR